MYNTSSPPPVSTAAATQPAKDHPLLFLTLYCMAQWTASAENT
jgi:hypothetical protein